MRAQRPRRPAVGRTFWAFVAVLAAGFVGFLVYQKGFVGRTRFSSDAELLDELQGARFLDDADPQFTRPVDAARWTQWRGQRRDGFTTMANLLRRWPEAGPPEHWRQPVGAGYSSFAVADGAVYTMEGADDGKEAVVCRDAATGAQRWRHTYLPSQTFQYGGPRATPTLDGDRLVTVSSAGVLMCLAKRDGAVVWQTDLVEKLGANPPRWGFAFSPLVARGLVFATPGGADGHCLAAFDAKTGKLAWASLDDPPGYSSPVGMTVADVPQVVFFTGKRLVGVTPEQGELLWEFPWPTTYEVNAATPLVIRAEKGGQLLHYVLISSGYKQGSALIKVSRDGAGDFNARAVWQGNDLCCHFASPVRHGDHAYALDEERNLTCINLRTGRVAWRAPADDRGGFQKGSLLLVDDTLLVLGEDGRLALVACDPAEYRELTLSRPAFGVRGTQCWTQPVLADGRLFLRASSRLSRASGRVLCLDVRQR